MRISDWSSDVCSSDLFSRLRALWKKSEQYVFVPERLRWLLTPDGRGRRAVDAITASGYGARADARIQDFNKALTPYRPEEHGMKDPKPGRRFKTYISFGINGPFIRPMSARSEEHTSELQSLMRIPYAAFCLKKKKKSNTTHNYKP